MRSGDEYDIILSEFERRRAAIRRAFDLDIGFCDHDWLVPWWMLLEITSEADSTAYLPLTFPPPCTQSNYTGVIGKN